MVLVSSSRFVGQNVIARLAKLSLATMRRFLTPEPEIFSKKAFLYFRVESPHFPQLVL